MKVASIKLEESLSKHDLRLVSCRASIEDYAESVTSSPTVRKRRRITVTLVAVLTATATVAAVLAVGLLRSGPDQDPLSLGTGPEGGVYFELGHTLQDLTRDSAVPLTAHESAASEINLRRLAEGDIDVGFSTSDVAHRAVTGEPPFDQPLPVRALGKLYDQPTHLVVLADSEIEQLTDLQARSVSVGAAGSGTRMQANRLLDVAGLTDQSSPQRHSMDLRDSAEALEREQIDAFFWSGGLPSQAVTDLAEGTPIRLVDLAEWAGPLGELGHGSYEDVPVPVNTYPQVPGIRTVGVSSLLMVRTDMPHQTAEAVTTEVFTSRSGLVQGHPVIRQLDERSAISTQPVELHPGALTYYRDAKPAHRPRQSSQPGE